MKKIIAGLSLVMCLSFKMQGYAAEMEMPVKVAIEGEYENQISVRAEQTCWYYRTVNGVKQKRLWSMTYEYWKTNWINC